MISVLALHYVEDIAPVLASIERWLVDNGALILVVEHPFATAVKPRRDLAPLPDQTTLSAAVDRYLDEGQVVERWFTDGVIKYHRRFGTWLSAIADAGLAVVRVTEPAPTEPHMNAQGIAIRQPFLAIAARKPAPIPEYPRPI